jgi:hypothetical protein
VVGVGLARIVPSMTVFDFLNVSINFPNVPAVVCPEYASSQTASAIVAAVGGVTVNV